MKKLAILVGVTCALQNTYAGNISAVKHGAVNGNYQIVFENASELPVSSLLQDSKALILDFPRTKADKGSKEYIVNENGIYSVDVISGDDKTRAVLNFVTPQKYRVTKKGKDIIVTLGRINHNALQRSHAGGKLLKIAPRSKLAPEINYAAKAPASFILAPIFKSNGKSAASFSFQLPARKANVRVDKNNSTITVDLIGVQISPSSQKRMDFSKYHSLIKYADIFRSARGAKIVLKLADSGVEYSSFQNGSKYTIDLSRPNQAISAVTKQLQDIQGFGGGKKYNGQPISLNFQDIEVRAVLQIIAEFTNTNIVVSDAVSGNITLRLDNVPWDQALDIILKTKNLGMRKNGNIIYVAPAEALDQSELKALKTVKELNELKPSRTEMIQVKYANAANIAQILEQSRQSGSNNASDYYRDSILSSKGTVTVDQRTNTLLVSDIPSKLEAVKNLVAKLDEPVRQVLIDARLVLTTDDFAKDLGAKFGITFFNSGAKGLVTGSGTVQGANKLNEELHNIVADKDKKKIELPDLNNRLGVKMATAGSSYGLAILAADFLVDLELSALQTEGRAEIVSSPRVVTQDGQKARIASGQQIPYVSEGANGKTKVEFKNAELSLDVTPRIAPDDRVDMTLDIKKDAPNPGLQSGGNIGLDTNQLETDVLVDNGETIVLGGIFDQTQSFSKEKVPLLGDLPVIGHAFSTTKRSTKKKELVIFVTPRIIDNKLSDYDKFSNLR